MNFHVVSPEKTEALLKAITENQSDTFRFGAGYTDLMLELRQQPNEQVTVINLAYLNDEQFTTIEKTDDGVRIGALVTSDDPAALIADLRSA